MRTKYAIKNIVTSLLLGVVVIVSTFCLQRVLAINLGPEYLGINSLFTTTISMLAIAELGFGSAVIFHLYKPVKKQDWTRINALIAFYKKIYRAIALVVFAVGLAILPFLQLIVGNNSVDVNIYFVFVLFLIASVVSYLLSYKRALLQADQKSYLIDIAYTSTFVLVAIIQIIVLSITHNYYFFLIGNILLAVISNLVINTIVHKRYINYKSDNTLRIDKKTKVYVFKQVRGLIFHKTSSFIVPGSSNIIISLLLGIKSVGLASNYFLISTAITTMTWKISTAITASVGNLLVDSDKDKLYQVYKRLQFGVSLLSTLVAALFVNLVNSFVSVWVGDEYVLSFAAIIPISITLYLTMMRIVPNSFKQAAGVFYEDRYVPIFEALINIIFGIVFAIMFGLEGVFWGLTVSTLFLHIYAYPRFVYKNILSLNPFKYWMDIIPYIVTTIFSAILLYVLNSLVRIENDLLSLIIELLIGFTIVITIWTALFFKTKEFKYYYELVSRASSQIRKVKDK